MSPNTFLKAMPNDLSTIGEGATYIWDGQQTMEPHSKGKIIGVLNSERANNPDFTFHEAGLWECFDRAYLGVSIVRCQTPGAPVGIAFGTALEGGPSVINQPHAILYFWHMMNGKWTSVLYDPLYGEINIFKPKAFISFPIYRPNYPYPGGKPQLLSPFDTMTPVDTGVIMMYNNFEIDKGYNLTNYNNVKSDLDNKRYKLCAPPAEYEKKRTREDRALWVYNQIRSKYKRSAIGFAWGIKIKEADPKKKDSAALVLWKNESEYLLWDVEQGKPIGEGDFQAKFILG
jgi:hypothetical protein